jgi:hypothetical protein
MDSLVRLVTRLRGLCYILVGDGIILFAAVYTSALGHTVAYRRLLFLGKLGRGVKLPGHLHPVPSLIVHVSFVPLMP